MAIQCPLPLAPIPVTKVWGGSQLRDFVLEGAASLEAGEGGPVMDWPKDEPVGEVWLLCDRDDRTSTVAAGPFAGRTLRGLMLSESDALLGDARAASGGTFPLLLKLLDAQQNLSVQVHPDAQAAAALGADEKNECWYVLDAERDAELFLGLAPEVDATSFARGAATPDIVDLLRRFPVRGGDGIDVPAGTVHAICAGVAIAEVQSNSDTTYRIYDWDREVGGRKRPIHLDEALRSIDYLATPPPPAPLEYGPMNEQEQGAPAESTVNRRAVLRDGERFLAEVLEVHEPQEMTSPGLPTALLVLSGSGKLVTRPAAGDDGIRLVRGSTWLLPADLESARVVEANGDLRVLRARPKVHEMKGA